MAFQFSTAARNAALDAIESTAGTAPTLEIRTGSAPATAGTADSGTLLASGALPSDWLAAASGGSKAKAGTWSLTASAAGTAGHFRIKQGATTHIQGPIVMGTTAGDGEMALVNTSIANTQPITVSAFTLNAGGA